MPAIKATKATKAAATKAAAADTQAENKPLYRSASRDAATIVAGAYPFKSVTDRDPAYLAFFGDVCRKHGGKATLSQIHEAGTPRPGKPHLRDNPRYSGSAKATDAGVITRLRKAGFFTISADGSTLTPTKLARETAAFNGKL